MGKPACVEIAFDRGVCGSAFCKNQPLVVADVHEFPGHIACDTDSRSEMVLPFHISADLCGVMDVDSPKLNRFTDDDKELLLEALKILVAKSHERQRAPQAKIDFLTAKIFDNPF
jgi:GAF domain-containing protein